MKKSSPSVVRLAVPADAEELWRLTLAAHNENALRTLSPQRIEWWMKRVLYPDLISSGDMGPRGIAGVIGPVGALEGMVLIIVGQFWYSEERHLEELIVFCDPHHRKTRHTETMLRWMKQRVEDTGLPLLTGILSKNRQEAKVRFYERVFGDPVGAFFFVTPKGSALPPALAVAASS